MTPRPDPGSLSGDPLFEDREDLRELGLLLMAGAPDPEPPDPFFRSQLRRRLMNTAAERRSGGFGRRLLGLDGSGGWAPRVAGLAAAAGIGLIAFAGYQNVQVHQVQEVAFESPLNHVTAVATARVIPIHFAVAMDHASVERALRVEPATSYRTTWRDEVLYIEPVNGLAPSTDYRLTIGTSATVASGGALARPLQLDFSTAPAPVAASLPLSPVEVGVSHEHPMSATSAETPEDTPRWAGDSLVVWRRDVDGSTPDLVAALPDGSGERVLAANVGFFATHGSQVAWVAAGAGSAKPGPQPSVSPSGPGLPLGPGPSASTGIAPTGPSGGAADLMVWALQGGTATRFGTVTTPWVGWLSDQELLGIRADGAYRLVPAGPATRLATFSAVNYTSFALQPTGRYLAAAATDGTVTWFDLAGASGLPQPSAAGAPPVTPGSTPTALPATPSPVAVPRPSLNGVPPSASPVPEASAPPLTGFGGGGPGCDLSGNGPLGHHVPIAPTELAWAASGDWLAYTRGASLWRVNAGGGVPLLLRTAGGSDTLSDPAVSPDGQVLLFQDHGCGDAGHLWVTGADGSSARRIGTGSGYRGLSLSPQGTSLLFAHSDSAPPAVWIADLTLGRQTEAENALAGGRVAIEDFMSARLGGHADAALNFLTDSGRTAYASAPVPLSSPAAAGLARFAVIAAQLRYDAQVDRGPAPANIATGGSAVLDYLVRLSTASPGAASASLLEAVTVVREGDGFLVDGVTQTPEIMGPAGPLVTSVALAPADTQSPGRTIVVRWNSELDAPSITPNAFAVLAAGGTSVSVQVLRNDVFSRSVTLIVGANAPGDYALQIRGVRDLNGTLLREPFAWNFSVLAGR